MPPSLRPTWSRPSSNELRMSLPIAAVGPLNVDTKPILIVFCWAIADAVARASIAQAASSVFFIEVLPEPVCAKGKIIVDRRWGRNNRQACPNATSCRLLGSCALAPALAGEGGE